MSSVVDRTETQQTVSTEATQHHGVPLPAVMLQLATGYWMSQAVGAVARLGIADLLAAGPRTSADLAQATSTHPQALFRVLRQLASIGVFAQPEPGVFALTPLGDTLRTDAPGSLRYFAITATAYGHWAPWGQFLDSVKTGKPTVVESLGQDLFGWFRENPEEAAYFSNAMGNISGLVASEFARVYDCTTAKTIVDVGGAHGVLLAATLHANPVARGILFDLPYVIATAMDTVQAQGIADRCELVAGDFFEFVPAGADLYLLKNIIHDWDDEHNDRLLATCHSAIAPGGKLVVVEMVVPADNQPTAVQGMDLNMLVMAGGRERTAAEYQTLLAGAGFRLDRIIPTHSPYSIIESTRL